MTVQAEIEAIYRSEYPRVLATLVRLLGDIDRAEEACHDAFKAALEQWPDAGIPGNPCGWLVSAGRFKGIDAIRRTEKGREIAQTEAAELERSGRAVQEPYEADDESLPDDQLRLVFTCCHPSLPVDSQISLALREVSGLTTSEIAAAYLASPETIKKRITRAKASLREQRIPYEIPTRTELGNRLSAVLHVIYLVYNEGFASSGGEHHLRTDLTSEAVSLARLVSDLLSAPEAAGLLSLLLFHESRRRTRVDDEGVPVPLERQDRSLWDQSMIREATELVYKVFLTGAAGPYSLQAAIASVHASAPSVAMTSWPVIVRYYDLLLRIQDAPVVRLNRAIAVGMRDGPQAGIDLIRPMVATGAELATYHLAHAAVADLERRAGRMDEARAAFRIALSLATQGGERRYLQRQIEELS